MDEFIDASIRAAAVEVLVKAHGEAERGRAARGVESTAALWRSEDGRWERYWMSRPAHVKAA